MKFRNLRWYELSFVAFFVVLSAVPEQAFAALRISLFLELPPSILQLGFTTVGGLMVLGLCLLRIYPKSEPWHRYAQRSPPRHRRRSLGKLATMVRMASSDDLAGCLSRIGIGDSSSFTRGWLVPLAQIALLLGIGYAFLVLGGAFVYVALVLCLPVVPLTQSILVNVRAYLFMYDPLRSSDVMYWSGVLRALERPSACPEMGCRR